MIDSYVTALTKELSMHKNTLRDYKIKTVFIGGGTPSILDINKLDIIINQIHKNFDINSRAEVTIECNPGTLTKEKLKFYKNIGINRLSIGLQSFNNEILKFIGRIHSKEDFIDNYNKARNAGFENINIDLIYGLPNQDMKDWEGTLKEVIKLKPEHVSAYSLKIEEGTVLYRLLDEKKLNLPSDEEDRDMYHFAIDLLNENRIRQYEISNFSKNGYECMHNLIYWNNEEYLGVGVSAHSYLNQKRFSNTNDINEYINFINRGELPIQMEEYKNKEDEITETIFLTLRLNKGLDLMKFHDRFQVSILDIYGDKIRKLIDLGLLTIKGNHIRLTSYGMDVSNQVFVEFL
jgi:oxygen-independent coproporphyrinogen-3 oxidase